MSEHLAKLAAAENGGRFADRVKKDHNDPKQKKALRQIQKEAAAKGSFLTSGGKGGLDSRLVLSVMQRDHYRCKKCGKLGDKKNGGIGIHHLGGIPETKELSKLGHKNLQKNLVAICRRCHDKLHAKAKEEHVDSSQVLPQGDKGTNRDHGDKPVAKPKH